MARASRSGSEASEPLTRFEFHVLVSLMDEDRHGLGITREVEERTGGEVWLGPGTLYPALKRLASGGMIEQVGHHPAPDLDNRRRRYFRLTEGGARVLAAEKERRKSEILQVDVKEGLAKGPRGALPSPEGA